MLSDSSDNRMQGLRSRHYQPHSKLGSSAAPGLMWLIFLLWLRPFEGHETSESDSVADASANGMLPPEAWANLYLQSEVYQGEIPPST